MADSELTEKEKYDKVRNALCLLVGSSELKELIMMREAMKVIPAHQEEIIKALTAIQTLIETFPADPEKTEPANEYIHTWFELTYAQYLTIPRGLLQSMPNNWQKRFVECLMEFESVFNWRPRQGRYWVRLKTDQGKFIHDPFMGYERGRRRITPEECKALMRKF